MAAMDGGHLGEGSHRCRGLEKDQQVLGRWEGGAERGTPAHVGSVFSSSVRWGGDPTLASSQDCYENPNLEAPVQHKVLSPDKAAAGRCL